MKLKLALIALLLIAALLVSGCCCCVIPSHRGYYRVPCLMRGMGHPMVKVTTTAVPAITATPTPIK